MSSPLFVALLLFAAGLSAVGSRAAATGDATSDDRVAGEYLIDLKPGVSAKKFAKKMAEKYGGKVVFTYDETIGGFAFQGPDSAAARIAKDRRVEDVEQNRKVRFADAPPDVGHLNRGDVPEAFAAGYTGAGVRVAVLDTGVDKGHEVFASHDNVLAGHGGCGGGSSNDKNGHGTHVASLVAGQRGVAHEARIIPVKVLPGGSDLTTWFRVICGLNWVKQHASEVDIVNISIAGPGVRALKKAVKAVLAEGIEIFAAAGNTGGATQAPARYGDVIAVSALAAGNKMAAFSSVGGEVTAPGSKIVSATKNGGYASKSGTSFSSPQAAGAGAIVLSENPALNVLDALRISGRCPDGDINGSTSACPGRWKGDDANAEPQINAYCAGVLADPVAVDLANCGF